MNILWEDILAQPENCKTVISHLLGAERSRLERAAQAINHHKPVAFIGVGSAAYLCMPSEVYLGQNGVPASVYYAPEALYNLLPSLAKCNVILNTRSGETVEIVKLAQALHAQKIPFITITNEPESSTAALSSHIVWSNSRKDDLVSINIVTSMMLTTLMLSAAALGTLDTMIPDIQTLPDLMQDVITRSASLSKTYCARFDSARPLYLIYRSTLKGAAFNGRLVLEEIGRTPGIAFEAGDFRQGPNEVIDDRFSAVVFIPSGKQGELNLSLAEDILDSGGTVMVIGNIGNWSDPRACIFPINNVSDFLLPVLAVIPLQVLAYHLAENQGYEPGTVRYISKIILTEEGIPNENGR